MKEKILMLIIGILIGAIITGGCFLIFGKNNSRRPEMGKERQNIGNYLQQDENGNKSNHRSNSKGTSQTTNDTTSTTNTANSNS